MKKYFVLYLLLPLSSFSQTTERRIELPIPQYRYIEQVEEDTSQIIYTEPIIEFLEMDIQVDSIYVFNTYEDFITDHGKYAGDFVSLSSNATAGDPKLSKIYVHREGEEIKLSPNDFFGFKINNLWFVNKTLHNGKQIVLIVLKEKGKFFYANGFHYLCAIKGNSTFSYELDKFYYSDSLNTTAYSLKKIRKVEKGNSFYRTLIDQLNKYYQLKGDRYDHARFKGISKAIMSF